MWPMLQGFPEEGVGNAEQDVGQSVGVARGDVLEVGVVDGVERPIVGAERQRVDDGGQVLDCGRTQGGRGGHDHQGFGGQDQLPEGVDVLNDWQKAVDGKRTLSFGALNILSLSR